MSLLLTRPEPQHSRSLETLQAAGIEVLSAPLLEIQAKPEISGLSPAFEHANRNTVIIAVSQHALQATQLFLDKQQISWPAQARYIAVGDATAKYWQELGVNAQVPQPQSSEGMLELIKQQASEVQHVIILRGEDGREWLAEQLQQQNISVNYLSCYQRHYKVYSTEQIHQWCQHVSRIVVNSAQILEHLVSLMRTKEQRIWLNSCTLLLPSQRLCVYAQEYGISHTICCEGASDEALIKAINRL